MLPNSIQRTLDRIKDDLNPGTEKELIKKHRRSKETTAAAVRFVLVLVLIPLLTQQITKRFVFMPAIDDLGRDQPSEVFLNSETREEVFKEIAEFEEDLEFAALTGEAVLSAEEREEKVQDKALEVFEEFQEQGKSAIGNVYADLSALGAAGLIFLFNRKQFIAFKEFVTSLASDVSDATKAFILILLSDVVVGFHSPHGWEVLIETVANHLGIVASHSAISLFIATVPVVMDTFFKYWLFSALTKMSPSTVATLKDMNE